MTKRATPPATPRTVPAISPSESLMREEAPFQTMSTGGYQHVIHNYRQFNSQVKRPDVRAK